MSETATAAPPERTTPLGGLEFTWDPRVLEPRPWTAAQSAWAVELDAELPDGPVLELCAGVGHIGLLAVAGTGRRGILVDADPVACRFARRNAERAGLAERVRVEQERIAGEPLRSWPFRVPLVLADPPYLPSHEVTEHPHDPVGAIDGGPDGLALIAAVLATTARCLVPGGICLLQVAGVEQAAEVRAGIERRWTRLGLEVLEVRGHGPRRAVVRLDRRPDDRFAPVVHG